MLKNRYKYMKPEESNGYANVLDLEAYGNSICTCYNKGVKNAKYITKALNLLNRKEHAKSK